MKWSRKNKRYYSGICTCGHSWESHHLGMVLNKEYYEATGEATVPGECCYYGSNEFGGMDSRGKDHCYNYMDKDDPKLKENSNG